MVDHPSFSATIALWVTQKPTSIQSGQSGRDAVEYDLREIDRASACGNSDGLVQIVMGQSGT